MAVGRIRMSYDDFCRCTPDEFVAICQANRDLERGEWERIRLLATVTVQPYAKDTLDPKKIMPFPWDSEDMGQDKPQPTKLTRQERYERFKYLSEKWDGIQQHHIDNLQA